MVQRLDKILVSQGIGSRSDMQRLIRAGRLTVDGRIVHDPSVKVNSSEAQLAVDGRPLRYQRHLYIMLNKPQGLLCVSRDPRQPTVLDLLPPALRRSGLFPAGRLDKDTVGLTLITDDGDFAHRMLSPRRHVEKTYQALIDGAMNEGQWEAFTKGLILEDGTVCMPAKLQMLEPGERSLMEIRISEGKYHQIKRMFAACGHKVLWLKRTAIGGLRLDETLEEGQLRELTEAEKGLVWQ